MGKSSNVVYLGLATVPTACYNKFHSEKERRNSSED